MQVVERMAASASGQGTARLYAYSGHDTTIMPILATLGVKLDDWPAYVSNVVSPAPLAAAECRQSALLSILDCEHNDEALLGPLQVFELWEGPGAEGGGSRHYVRVLYNKQELSLAHHPKGANFAWQANWCSCAESRSHVVLPWR